MLYPAAPRVDAGNFKFQTLTAFQILEQRLSCSSYEGRINWTNSQSRASTACQVGLFCPALQGQNDLEGSMQLLSINVIGLTSRCPVAISHLSWSDDLRLIAPSLAETLPMFPAALPCDHNSFA